MVQCVWCACVSVSKPSASSPWPQPAPWLRSTGGTLLKQLWEQADLQRGQMWWQSCSFRIPGLLLAQLFGFDFCSPECLHDNPRTSPYLCSSLPENPVSFLPELIVLSVSYNFPFLLEVLLYLFFTVFFQTWVKFTLAKDFCDVCIRVCFLRIYLTNFYLVATLRQVVCKEGGNGFGVPSVNGGDRY